MSLINLLIHRSSEFSCMYKNVAWLGCMTFSSTTVMVAVEQVVSECPCDRQRDIVALWQSLMHLSQVIQDVDHSYIKIALDWIESRELTREGVKHTHARTYAAEW